MLLLGVYSAQDLAAGTVHPTADEPEKAREGGYPARRTPLRPAGRHHAA